MVLLFQNMVEVVETLKLNRLKFPSDYRSSPDNLFHEISRETGARLHYTPGNKDKKEEPYVKIVGLMENVTKAKILLLDRLETQSNRVVLKLDVTHAEHPSLIGRKGRLIQKVMDSTGCHIHFPDVNKKPYLEKNNQVAIYGDPVSVERAKVMIRALMPLQFFFDVPASSLFRSVLESAPAEGLFLAKHRGLLLHAARPRPCDPPVVVVRCDRDQYPALRRDIAALMELVCCTNGANLPPVHVLTDIAAHHRHCVREWGGVDEIAQRTGAAITFTEQDRGSGGCCVRISGNLDCVYMAWQEVMNILPASVSFDVNETRETEGQYKDFLQDCGIKVKTYPKNNYHIKNVTAKGPEKLTKQMLQYRQHLLRLPILDFKRDIHDMNLAVSFLSAISRDTQPSTLLSESVPSALEDVFLQLSTGIAALFIEASVPRGVVLSSESRGKEESFNISAKPSIFTNNNWMGSAPVTKGNEKNFDISGKHPIYTNNNWIRNASLNEDSESSTTSVEAELCSLKDDDFPLADDYYRKKHMAAEAMRRPIESTQTPSREWVGCGFSRSMPAAVIKEGLLGGSPAFLQLGSTGSRSSSVDSEAWDVPEESNSLWPGKRENVFCHSNYFDFLRIAPESFDDATKLPELLWKHGLHKYMDLFAKQEVDYQTFLMLTEEDLHSLGIESAARIKIICLIRELQEEKRLSRTFDAAPGAERKDK